MEIENIDDATELIELYPDILVNNKIDISRIKEEDLNTFNKCLDSFINNSIYNGIADFKIIYDYLYNNLKVIIDNNRRIEEFEKEEIIDIIEYIGTNNIDSLINKIKLNIDDSIKELIYKFNTISKEIENIELPEYINKEKLNIVISKIKEI